MFKRAILLFLFALAAAPAGAEEKIRITATTGTIADLAGKIAGDKAEVYFVASPHRDVHFIQPTPKDVLKVKRADVFVHGGLDLEIWREPLLTAAGNAEFLGAGRKAVDVSRGIELLEIPARVSRSEGDIHLFGNPHYWLDPSNGKKMAANIAKGLSELYPQHAAQFQKNLEAFESEIDSRIAGWKRRLPGGPVVTYHNSWPYFARAFGFEIIGRLEPKPGIPPTAKHLVHLSALMKEKNARLIIKESYQEDKMPKRLAEMSGGKVVELVTAVGGAKGAADYVSLFEHNVSQIEAALKGEER